MEVKKNLAIGLLLYICILDDVVKCLSIIKIIKFHCLITVSLDNPTGMGLRYFQIIIKYFSELNCIFLNKL